jgi:hypothetical protein
MKMRRNFNYALVENFESEKSSLNSYVPSDKNITSIQNLVNIDIQSFSIIVVLHCFSVIIIMLRSCSHMTAILCNYSHNVLML